MRLRLHHSCCSRRCCWRRCQAVVAGIGAGVPVIVAGVAVIVAVASAIVEWAAGIKTGVAIIVDAVSSPAEVLAPAAVPVAASVRAIRLLSRPRPWSQPKQGSRRRLRCGPAESGRDRPWARHPRSACNVARVAFAALCFHAARLSELSPRCPTKRVVVAV